MAHPSQLRAARALCGLSQTDVAKMVGTSTKTIRRAEGEGSQVAEATVTAIKSALEGKGVEFIEENGGGPGVRLQKSYVDGSGEARELDAGFFAGAKKGRPSLD